MPVIRAVHRRDKSEIRLNSTRQTFTSSKTTSYCITEDCLVFQAMTCSDNIGNIVNIVRTP